ncbi:PREDICTED: uncharacterized protein LOC100634558 [Amphimedon queenslandica]|uniref:adenosine deaminase n=1 Tax=Amphimedon queenslandica TaxID=400682 RepID=A0A1X7V8P7_AMPQE|nr:PREDICTED: uncharacterized protein LOC100634558 [Amphimedon queenslandica]|eukprot:XP_003385387.1 PREDICTED: uncharacterized protein LOC100634558 [Amphimedon queenslandica]
MEKEHHQEIYKSLPKVELHNHLDGACRLKTLMDMCRKDDLDAERFPYHDTEAFRKVVSLTEPQESLVEFLKPFPNVCYILSTAENLERQAIEFCEDQKRNSVIYTESRLCPFLFTERGLNIEEVLQSVLVGFSKGEKRYGVKIRTIICFLKSFPEWSPALVDLAIKYKDKGVVGVDVAGDELQPMDQHIPSFIKAKEAGLHITAHAGESGPAENVRQAIDVLSAERIGHGYHVVDDDSVYLLAKNKSIHFEVCLTSSIYTKSMEYESHSVKRFVKDSINFGLNTDDSGIIGTSLTNECKVGMTTFGLKRDEVIQAMFDSARSSFLPADEKEELIEKLSVLVREYKEKYP